MKSIKIIRVLSVIMLLALGTNVVVSASQHNAKAAIESSAALLCAAPFANASLQKNLPVKRKALTLATIVRRPGSMEIMKSDPILNVVDAGKSTEAVGSRGNVKMNVYDVLPESTIGGLLEYTLTADNTHIATRALPFIPNKNSDTLPSGVTFSDSSFSTFADYVNYYANTTLMLGDVQVTTDNTANFAKKVTATTTTPTGSTKVDQIKWDSISLDPNAYNDKVRIIRNSGFISGTPVVKYECYMVPSSYLSFSIQIVGVADAKTIRRF
jgi:hypothetical protein